MRRAQPSGLRSFRSPWRHRLRLPRYKAPRTPFKDGKPDLNGIWQAINTANWDIQDHVARQGPVLELGAAFSVPAGVGVVEGESSRIALGVGEEEGECRELDDARSGDQVLHAGRTTRHLHALSVSDRADAHARPDGVRVREREPHHLHEQQGEGADRLRGWAGRAADGKATRWSWTSPGSTTRPGSIAPGIFTATRCTSSNAIRYRSAMCL